MSISNVTLIKVAASGFIVSSLMFTIVGLSLLPKVLREGRMRSFRGSLDPFIVRNRDPAGFWSALILYGLGMLAMLAVAVWFGLEVFVFKKWK
jgi:hypothetical protein